MAAHLLSGSSHSMQADLERCFRRLYPLLPVLAVAGITARLYWNLAKATDLAFADEAFYLGSGGRLRYEGLLPNFQYSPLYAIWYALHLAATGDPISAYYAQMYVCAFLTVVLTYLYLRSIEIPKGMGALGALLWVAQPAYMRFEWGIGWSRPYHFAFLVFLAGALTVRKLKPAGRIPVVLGSMSFLLLAAAVRSEYLGCLILFACLVGLGRHSGLPENALRSRRYIFCSVCLSIAVTTLVAWMYLRGRPPEENPFFAVDRSWCNFGETFSIYQLGLNGDGNLSPWYDWQIVLAHTFPGAHNIAGAAFASPKAFAHFELYNVLTLPRIICSYVMMQPYPLIRVMVLCLAFVWISLFTSTSTTLRRSAFATTGSTLGPYVLSGAAVLLPNILMTPRITLLLPFLFLLFVGVLKWLSIVLESEPRLFRSASALCGIALSLVLLVIPSPFDSHSREKPPRYLEMTQLRDVLEGRRLKAVRLLKADAPGICAFLPRGLVRDTVEPVWRLDAEPFWDFMHRKRIDAVLVNDELRSMRQFRHDPDFFLFLRSPNQFGWSVVPVGTRGEFLYRHDSAEASLRR